MPAAGKRGQLLPGRVCSFGGCVLCVAYPWKSSGYIERDKIKRNGRVGVKRNAAPLKKEVRPWSTSFGEAIQSHIIAIHLYDVIKFSPKRRVEDGRSTGLFFLKESKATWGAANIASAALTLVLVFGRYLPP